MAGSLDSCFGPSFLKAPFWPQKGSFKGQKQPVTNPFCNYIKWLLRSDPQPFINMGFRTCTGVYCTYIASDDICYPTMLSELASALEKSGADFAYGDMFIVDDTGNILRKFELPDYSFKQCFQNWYLCGVARLYRKELHQKFGFYDESLLAHDVELYLRFAINGAKFEHVPRVLMAVRDHGPERLIDIHSPTNWSRLIEECKEQVRKARRFSDSMST